MLRYIENEETAVAIKKSNPIAPIVLATLAPDTLEVAETKIPFQVYNRAIVVDGRINNAIDIPFELDSGASDVSIPLYVFQKLRQSGSIAKSDLRGEKNYIMADGHIGKSQTFILHFLRIGDVTVRDVEASVGGPIPLLGQSFLMKFKSWSIDNTQSIVVLIRQPVDR